jgi:transposase-like protein
MVKNLKDLMSKFKDEQACRDYLVQQRWNGVPECPYCGCRKSYRIENGKRFKCANKECYKKYSVTVGTIFEASNIPLSTWFPAVYLVTSHKKGISSVQLAKHLGITQKSAWFVIMRIRESLREKAPLLLKTEVQADEAYIGGLEDNKHKEKRAKSIKEAGANKMPVVGIIETGGRVVTKVMPWITKSSIEDLILTHVDRSAVLVTDGLTSYAKVGRKFEHVVINKDEGRRKVGRFHTNGIENYWSQFSRMIHGTYHQISDKHLQRYCDEMAYRFNSRKLYDGFRFLVTFQQLEGRLTYKNLTANGKDPKKSGGYPIEEIETGE